MRRITFDDVLANGRRRRAKGIDDAWLERCVNRGRARTPDKIAALEASAEWRAALRDGATPEDLVEAALTLR